MQCHDSNKKKNNRRIKKKDKNYKEFYEYYFNEDSKLTGIDI